MCPVRGSGQAKEDLAEELDVPSRKDVGVGTAPLRLLRAKSPWGGLCSSSLISDLLIEADP